MLERKFRLVLVLVLVRSFFPRLKFNLGSGSKIGVRGTGELLRPGRRGRETKRTCEGEVIGCWWWWWLF